MNDAHNNKAIRRYLRIQGAGGMLLAACFFLPAVKSCGSPVVPAKDSVELIEELVGIWRALPENIGPVAEKGELLPGIAEVIYGTLGFPCMYFGPYFFGLSVFLLTLLYRRSKDQSGWSFDQFLSLLLVNCALFALLCESYLTWIVGTNGTGEWAMLLLLFAAAACFVYWLVANRNVAGRAICMRWMMAVGCLYWFGWWVVFEFAAVQYGMWMSIAGAFAIWLGCIGQVRVLHACGWRSAWWRLATCCVWATESGQPRCRQCGYLLIGLQSDRCPECGLTSI